MSFSISPKGAPASASEANQPSQAAQSARERAIARLSGNQPQAAQKPPVSDPNAVSVEDLSAIAPAAAALPGQSNTTEATSDTALTPEKGTEEPISPQYAVLARKEKALRAKAQAQDSAYKAKEAALMAREEAIKAKESEYQTGYVSKDKLQNDTWGTLTELGYTYEQLTQMALNQTQESPQSKAAIQALRAELQAIKDEQSQIKNQSQEQQTRAYEQAVAQITRDAESLVSADPVAYEAIHKSGSVNEVVELIKATFKEENVLMTVEEAAQEIENYLVEQSLKYASFDKVKKKLQPATPTPSEQPTKTTAQQPQPTKTLTNGMGASRQLSARERAILAFKGEKKS